MPFKKIVRKVDRKMKDFGEFDDDKKQIRVNPAKGGLLNTILHEEEHAKDFKANESKIKKRAKKKEKKLTINKAIKLLSRFGSGKEAVIRALTGE